MIAKKVEYEDREVLVAIPVPDTIVLITDVFNHHLTQPNETGGTVASIFQKIDEEMIEKVAGYKTYESYAPFPATQIKPGKKAVAIFKPP